MIVVIFCVSFLLTLVIVGSLVVADRATSKRQRVVAPPATQAGAAMLYYRIAQEETRLLERLVIADQAVPVFIDPNDRVIACGLIGTFYYEQPPAIDRAEPIQRALGSDPSELAMLRAAAHYRHTHS